MSSVNPSDAGSNYNVIISGVCSPSTTSANVALMVNSLPSITTDPTDQVSCTEKIVKFNVTATGSALTYQWRKGTANLVNAGNIAGANSPTLVISPTTLADTSAFYNVVINGACSPAKTSANASLSMCNLVGMNEIISGQQYIILYPNPLTTTLNILVKDGSQLNNTKLKIFSVTGALVKELSLNSGSTSVEMEGFKSGVYFYSLIQNNQSIQYGKIIAQ